MILRSALAAAALALASPAFAAEPCLAFAQAPWPAAGDDYSVEVTAGSSGACGEGATTVAVRSSGGDIFWTQAQVTKVNDFLNDAADSADLGKRLAEMIDPAKIVYRSTADLPEWKKGAKSPMSGALPFFPDQDDRDWYAATRAERDPLLCYREATGYLGCYALVPDGPNFTTMMKVGQLRLS